LLAPIAKRHCVNSKLLKRLFKAVSEGSNEDVRKVCIAIVSDSKNKNHHQLASELENILKSTPLKQKVFPLKPFGGSNDRQAFLDNRAMRSFVSVTRRDELEHHMILSAVLEERFLKIESEFAARERLATYGLKPRKKILLYGPPGCGKTLGAKRLAWNTGLNFIKVKFDAMVSSLFGESASNLRAIFEFAQNNPSLLLLDECDFIARSRNGGKDIGEVHRIVNTLLQLLEDYDPPGMVVATTNIYDQLDHALFRRFDDVINIVRPRIEENERLLKDSFAGMKIVKGFPWNKIAEHLDGMSAADVVNIAKNACKGVILKGQEIISIQSVEQAIEEYGRKSHSLE